MLPYMNADKLMNLLPNNRHRVHLKPRHRGKYRSRNRTRMTPDELIAYLVQNNIKTSRDLLKRRGDDRDTPYLSDYLREFGSWSATVTKAFNKSSEPFAAPKDDPKYILDCCLNFHIWSQQRYLSCRRVSDVIPSSRQVRRIWGNFGNLLYEAKRLSAQKTFEAYLKLERRLGHIPTSDDCREAHIDLTPLRRLLGSKWDLDNLIALRNRTYNLIQKAS